MKSINFNAVKVLPNLLNKNKIQTIRKAWKNCLNCYSDSLENCKYCKGTNMLDKSPKFEVGDEIQLFWDKGNNWDWFDKKTGLSIKGICDPSNWTYPDWFHKRLGTVKITEVFEIGMDNNCIWNYLSDKKTKNNNCWFGHYSDEVARKDGFNSSEEMFTYFNKNYDLSSPKKFYVYRWEWIK